VVFLEGVLAKTHLTQASATGDTAYDSR
jgi:hypothetical protein